MTTPLPERPNLEQYRKQAKDLVKRAKAADPASAITLTEAQFTIAREHGFESWPKFVRHLEGLSPLAGTWVANVAKSKRHPANPFRSATLDIDVNGNEVTFTDVTIDDAGRDERSTHTVHADGRPRAGDHGYTLVARWIGRRVLETAATKDGEVAGTGRYEVSADGQTLIVTGAGDQRLVLERLRR